MNIDVKDESVTLSPGPSLCVQDIREIHDTLLGQLPGATAWQIDLGSVEDCDSAGVQWLLMLRKWAREAGIDLKLVNVADPVREVLELYNLADPLGQTGLLALGEEGLHV